MKRKRYLKFRQTSILVVTAFAVFSLCPVKASAVESIMLPTQVVGDDVVSMSIPVVSDSETSVFDFILDPQRLLYRTDAARYGGGVVEEDAPLLFYNKEGDYNFSHHSDWLTVTNRSTVPVQVTITAQVTDIGDIKLVESADFAESTDPDVYLAIVDDQGNIQPLSADGQASVSFEMDAAPENTYVFRLDEETHTYQYGMSMDPASINFDTYSFGLVGACNSDAEWQNISVHPMIAVTWYVEPIIPEEQEEVPVEDNNIGSESDAPDDDDKLVDESTDNDVDDEIDQGDESNQDDENGQDSENNQGGESGQGNENGQNDESGESNNNDSDQGDEYDDDNPDDSHENDNGQDEGVVGEE